MKSEIIWQTGTPTEFGIYLTLRRNRKNKSLRVTTNQYATNEVCNTPLPEGLPQGWQIQSSDNSEIIGWCKLSDIKIKEIKIVP